MQHNSSVARLPLLSFLSVDGCCGTRSAQTVLALYPSTVRAIRSVFDSADSLENYLCVLDFLTPQSFGQFLFVKSGAPNWLLIVAPKKISKMVDVF